MTNQYITEKKQIHTPKELNGLNRLKVKDKNQMSVNLLKPSKTSIPLIPSKKTNDNLDGLKNIDNDYEEFSFYEEIDKEMEKYCYMWEEYTKQGLLVTPPWIRLPKKVWHLHNEMKTREDTQKYLKCLF